MVERAPPSETRTLGRTFTAVHRERLHHDYLPGAGPAEGEYGAAGYWLVDIEPGVEERADGSSLISMGFPALLVLDTVKNPGGFAAHVAARLSAPVAPPAPTPRGYLRRLFDRFIDACEAKSRELEARAALIRAEGRRETEISEAFTAGAVSAIARMGEAQRKGTIGMERLIGADCDDYIGKLNVQL
jgi:hypothetical protein